MKLLGRFVIAAAVWLAGISAALAQNSFPTPQGSGAIGNVVMCPSTANALLFVPCDATNPLATSTSATITFPTFGAAFPATGIANGMSQGGNLTAMTGTAGNLNVNCQVGCSGGSFNNNADGVATSTTNGQVAAWGYVWNGTTWDRAPGTTAGVTVRSPTAANFLVTLPAETTKVLGTVRNVGSVGGIFDAVAGAAVPANSLQIGMAQGGNLVTMTGTSGNLNVQCANCSGSGVSTADEATFTAGTSLFAGTGGFFQTTATANALTNGQQGMWQMTAQRAGFVNLRAVGGTEIGTSAAEVFVGGRGSAGTAAGGVLTVQGVASMTKLLVTPDSVALPANQSVNVSQINAVTPLMGNGVTGTGSPRVTIASDNTAFSVNATLSAETTKVIGTVNQGTSPWVISGSLTANQSVNVSQFNGVTALMGNGATGTGSVRVTIANDNTFPTGWGASTLASGSVASGAYASGAFASGSIASGAIASGAIAAGAQVDLLTMRGTKAPGTAAANSILGGGLYTAAGVTLTDGQQAALQFTATGDLKVVGTGVAQGSTTSGQTGSLVMGAVTTAAPTYTTAQTSPVSLQTDGSQRVAVTNTPAVTATLGAETTKVIGTVNQGTSPWIMGPSISTLTTNITRPANTTAYSPNNTFANSTSAPTAGGFTLTNACRVSGGNGIIKDAIVSTSAGSYYQGEIWIFDQAVTAVNDAAAFLVSAADVLNLVGVIPFTTSDITTGANVSFITNIDIGYTCVGTANLRYLVKTVAAFTPASAEVLSVRLKVHN